MPIAKIAGEIFTRHEIDSFVGSCLGGALGRLLDCGVTDSEIIDVVTDLVASIHAMQADPIRQELFSQLFAEVPDERPIS
jgi:hypothetical protein